MSQLSIAIDVAEHELAKAVDEHMAAVAEHNRLAHEVAGACILEMGSNMPRLGPVWGLTERYKEAGAAMQHLYARVQAAQAEVNRIRRQTVNDSIPTPQNGAVNATSIEVIVRECVPLEPRPQEVLS